VGVAGDKRSKVYAELGDRHWVRFADLRAISETTFRSAIAATTRSGMRDPERGLFDARDLDPLRGLIEYAANVSPAHQPSAIEEEVE
jgi:hypothetical protein